VVGVGFGFVLALAFAFGGARVVGVAVVVAFRVLVTGAVEVGSDHEGVVLVGFAIILRLGLIEKGVMEVM